MGQITCLFSLRLEAEADAVARGLRHRDPDLLDRLIEQYHYRLFRYLTYLTGRRDAAEDLFQEVWIRVLERGHQYDGRRRFETWLFAIARHLVIDRARKQPAQGLESLDDPEEQQRFPQTQVSHDPSPLDSVTSHEESDRVSQALDQLPAIYRESLLLRFQEDMTIEEIATLVSAPISTVKSRIYRGLESLRDLLEQRP
ncbi:MAG: RNA polymerase sigma factor [Terriglobia bacterium]